mgnify:CR=1 FL=1
MIQYMGIREMTTPVSVAHVVESEDGVDTILVNSGDAAQKILNWEEQSRRVGLMQAEVDLLRRQLEDVTAQRDEAIQRASDDVRRVLADEKAKRDQLQSEVDALSGELDEANAKITVQSASVKAITKQLEESITFEDAVATMQEFNRCSVNDQRFKKYILRRACTHIESVWGEAKKQYPEDGGISGVPALIPAFEVERLVREAVERVQSDAANYKF